MPIATITDVQSIDHANSKPGRVTFSDGKKLTTFNPDAINAAQNLRGQRCEYTTETKGKYTNLASVSSVAGGAEAPAVAASSGVESLLRQILAELQRPDKSPTLHPVDERHKQLAILKGDETATLQVEALKRAFGDDQARLLTSLDELIAAVTPA